MTIWRTGAKSGHKHAKNTVSQLQMAAVTVKYKLIVGLFKYENMKILCICVNKI